MIAAGMYEAFGQLDGSHPWRLVSPEGYQDYQARYRPGGRVVYFNYPLAAGRIWAGTNWPLMWE